MIKRYCYLKDEFIGVMYFLPNDEYRFEWADVTKFSPYAQKFHRLTNFDDSRHIRLYIQERCIPRERPERSVWLSLVGLKVDASNRDIFLASRGMSFMDTFNMRETIL